MISKRVQGVSPSETLKISAKAKQMKREGKSVISLSAGEPDFLTPAHICNAAIDAITAGQHKYTMNTGMPELREAVCEKLKRDNNLDYSPDQILVSNGAKQSIGFSILTLINPGDEVIIPAPYWVSYPEMVKVAEGKPVIVKTDFENHYKLTAEELKKSISKKTKALILCSPSNPTGACYTPEELTELAEVLDQHPDIIILSDEIYEYIVFDHTHTSILNAAPELKERTVLINGFSKGYAMTGWRLGYLAAENEITSAVAKLQSQETSAPSSISQAAGIAAYKGSMKPVTDMKNAFRERRDYIVDALNQIENVRCFKPSGAFYVFPDISGWLGSKTATGEKIKSSTDLCLHLLDRYGVAAVPGDAFGEPSGIRLSYASSMDDLKEAIRRIRLGIQSLQK